LLNFDVKISKQTKLSLLIALPVIALISWCTVLS